MDMIVLPGTPVCFCTNDGEVLIAIVADCSPKQIVIQTLVNQRGKQLNKGMAVNPEKLHFTLMDDDGEPRFMNDEGYLRGFSLFDF